MSYVVKYMYILYCMEGLNVMCRVRLEKRQSRIKIYADNTKARFSF